SEEYLVLYTRDRVETTSQVWLGTTAGCAVCHDHKFDPLNQREFYSLAAFFNNTTQAAMDGNVKDTPPVLPVPRQVAGPRFEALKKELLEARKQAEVRMQAARPDFDRWLSAATAQQLAALIPADWLRLHAPLNEGNGTAVNLTLDGKPRTVTLAG